MATKTDDKASLQEAPLWMHSDQMHCHSSQNPGASMYTKIGTCTNLVTFYKMMDYASLAVVIKIATYTWFQNKTDKYRNKIQLSRTATQKQPVSKVRTTFHDYCSNCYCENLHRLQQFNQCALFSAYVSSRHSAHLRTMLHFNKPFTLTASVLEENKEPICKLATVFSQLL